MKQKIKQSKHNEVTNINFIMEKKCDLGNAHPTLFFIWFVRLLALRPLLACYASLGG
jgi:hypothetical protein